MPDSLLSFGEALQVARKRDGLRQEDLSEALGRQVARSTIANIEAGRERPSERFWLLLCAALPQWRAELAESFSAARGRVEGLAANGGTQDVSKRSSSPNWALGGPFLIESVQFSYIFRDSKSPEEIIEVRRVRATRAGADGYGLKLVQTEHDALALEEEPLWGGQLRDVQHHRLDGRTVYLRHFDFGRTLRKGDVHEFATRSWVARDPSPGTNLSASFSIPCKSLGLHLTFLGPRRPVAVDYFGPIPDSQLMPLEASAEASSWPGTDTTYSAYFSDIQPGSEYGLTWRW